MQRWAHGYLNRYRRRLPPAARSATIADKTQHAQREESRVYRVRSTAGDLIRRFARQRSTPIVVRSAAAGTFADFRAKLLTVESGLDPARFAQYVRDYDVPVMRYPQVSQAGRLIRDPHGKPRLVPLTVAAYFRSLGVGSLFDPADPGCIRTMQYAVVNALGFIGYQFGEAALMQTGHYRPAVVRVPVDGRERRLRAYYLGSLGEATWRAGITQIVHTRSGTRNTMLATDVNRWHGTFTGKDGIRCLADLKGSDGQERVLRRLFDANHRTLTMILSRHGSDAAPARHTWSGLLAAAHLCGPYAVASYVLHGTGARDEFATKLTDYLQAFDGFATPYDAPAER